MSHPFEVGKTYRNRVSEYEVQAIEGDKMTIRYASGGTLVTRASIQARIWENIHFEEQMAREDERRRLAREARLEARKRAARAKKAAAAPKFAGFQEIDFEPKKRGIAWSTRQEAGKFLAYTLSQKMGVAFGSWIVPRRSEVHVALKAGYDKGEGEKNAAFFVKVDETGVTYGFRVGNPDGKVKAGWPWSALLEALLEDDTMRRAIRATMKNHELVLDVYAMDVSYGRAGQLLWQQRGFLWEVKTADQDLSQKMNWNQLVEQLKSLSDGKRCNVYLCKKMPAEDALKSGAEAPVRILEIFDALLPVYDACVSG